MAGPSGIGKTILAIKLIAHITTGMPLDDGTPIEVGEVLAWLSEDVPETTLVPNLMAHGANLDKVHFPDQAKILDEKTGKMVPVPFNPARHILYLSHYLDKRPGVTLLVLDPILALANDQPNSHNTNQIRVAIEPLKKLCKDRGIACLGITHFLKRHNASGSTVQDRIIGSQAWVAVCRIITAMDWMQGERRGWLRVPGTNIARPRDGWEY